MDGLDTGGISDADAGGADARQQIELRVKEFGSDFARCIAAGPEVGAAELQLFEQADAQTAALYQAARQRSPIGVMLQLGRAKRISCSGHTCRRWCRRCRSSTIARRRLQWKFQNSRAQGTVNDELYVAFG